MKQLQPAIPLPGNGNQQRGGGQQNQATAGQQHQKNNTSSTAKAKGKGTAVCHFWRKGTCNKGAQCTFAHPPGEKGKDVTQHQQDQVQEEPSAGGAEQEQHVQ